MTRVDSGDGRRPAARRGDGDRLREEILDVTARMLEETGDSKALSLRKVAREVGVTPTSIYLHFDSLKELTATVKMQAFDRLSAVLMTATADAKGSPRERVRAFVQAYVDFAFAHPGLYQVWFTSELSVPPDGSPENYIGQTAFDVVRGRLAEVVGDDQAEMFTVQAWCALHGIILLRTNRPLFNWPDLDSQLDDLVTRLLSAGAPERPAI
ncbi:TetR/AcrR family transcriptional regulator [Spelaeicoccus albus]|uniref:AcrR family transcriptional regulator n=1 Tax=Spelaeicoccus albus TaxID=1280376 RepID=A0A7Z0CZM5_9MICO|nr:TetR/AcrR family transcriptional regulator [Spelaeicoccus albus]NYI66399.1 AcrR family transcriptional regulator [Spelaeicoccus albus]